MKQLEVSPQIHAKTFWNSYKLHLEKQRWERQQ